jgi:hypothetical protein
MAPTITSTCIECGMEKGHSLLYCPTCTLVKNQQEQFEKLQTGSISSVGGSESSTSETIGEIIGMIIGVVGFYYFLVWLCT